MGGEWRSGGGQEPGVTPLPRRDRTVWGEIQQCGCSGGLRSCRLLTPVWLHNSRRQCPGSGLALSQVLNVSL